MDGTIEAKRANSAGDDSRASPLEQLLSGEPITALRSCAWPTKYAVCHGNFSRLPAWMRATELSSVATLRALCPTAELSATHSNVPYQAPLSNVAPDVAELLVRFGLTLSFGRIAESIPGARAWLDELAGELGLPRPQVDVMIFASAEGRGLTCHFDAYDALIVQLHGRKTWRVSREPALKNPLDIQYVPGSTPSQIHAAMMPEGLPEAAPRELDEVLLSPGSVLFVPRGTWHETAASDGTSISASVLLNAPSIGDVLLQQLRKVIAQVPNLRAPALGFAGNEDQRQRASEAFDVAASALARNVSKLSAQATFEACASRGTLAACIERSTRFVRDPSRHIDVDGAEREPGAEVLRVRIVGTGVAKPSSMAADALWLPPVALPPLRWLAERRGVFSAADLCDAFAMFDFASLAGLLAELVSVKALVLIPFGPPAGTSSNG